MCLQSEQAVTACCRDLQRALGLLLTPDVGKVNSCGCLSAVCNSRLLLELTAAIQMRANVEQVRRTIHFQSFD